MTDAPFRVVVADDESLALSGVVTLLATDTEVEVVGAYENGASASEGIALLRPDIVMLDIRMPGLSGLEVVSARDAGDIGAVVFITAYDRFALDAFDVSAVDYVLKPFTDERFYAAVARAKRRVRERIAERSLEQIERAGRDAEASEVATQLVVREAGKAQVVQAADIDWIEGADYYSRVHLGGHAVMIRESLASLTARLGARMFFRAHKSAVVNLTRVREIRVMERGDVIAVLRDGTRLKLGRGRRKALEDALRRARAG